MSKELLKKHFKLIGLLFAAFLLVYYVPQPFNSILFLIFPILFIKSKENYIWIAFLFVILEQPGGLFFGGTKEDALRLPLYNIAPGISLSFDQLLIFAGLYKAISIKEKFNPFFKKPLVYLLFYFFILIILSMAAGMSFDGFKLVYKMIVNFTLFYSLFFLMRNEEEWKKFFAVLFPFTFYALLLQIYSLINGYQLVHLFKKEILSAQGVLGNTSSLEWDRPIELVHISFVCFFISIFYILNKTSDFKKLFLIAVNTISFLTIFFTGTRAWIIALIFSYLLLLLSNPKKIGNVILRFGIIIILGFTLLTSFSIMENQLGQAFDRFKTLEFLAKGDITAGGTAQRFDIRAPAVINAFENSNELFGAGFSDYYFYHADGHVGYQNFLFNAGIIGSILLLFFLTKYISNLIKINNQIQVSNQYKNSINIFVIAIIAILILHSSTQFLGYDVIPNRILTLTIFLYFSLRILKKAIENNSILARTQN